MTLDLVPRSARAVAEQINKYYRVFKGVDPDTILIRLPSGGAFQVLHSVTGLPILSVSDAGFDATIGTGDLADGIVTTPKLANQAVTNVKIADGTIGTQHIADQQITSAKITDGTIATIDLADQAVTTPKLADGSVTAAKLATSLTGQLTSTSIAATSQSASGAFTDLNGSGLGVTAAGRPLLVGVTLIGYTGTLVGTTEVQLWEGAALAAALVNDTLQVGQFVTKTSAAVVAPAAGPHSYKLVWKVSAGTVSIGGGLIWALVV